MKVAIIPPVGEMQSLIGNDKFHLILGHLCNIEEYRLFFNKKIRDPGYVILDNSAYEASETLKPPIFSQMVKWAEEMEVDEIVLTDKLLDSVYTFDSSMAAARTLMRFEINKRIMYVPQGQDFKEWDWCFTKGFVQLEEDLGYKTPVIGLSKIYDTAFEKEGGRLKLLERLAPLWSTGRIEIHLLGFTHLKYLERIVAEFGNIIRSTDTCKPVLYAMTGKAMSYTEMIHRSPHYFESTLSSTDRLQALANIGWFRSLAEDRSEVHR